MIFFWPFYYVFKEAPENNIPLESSDYIMLLLTIAFFGIPWVAGLITILKYFVGWK